jgi:chorismate--pyruvate lyase
MLIKLTSKTVLPIKNQTPEALLPWLTHQDSLTELLKSKAGDARLALLRQAWDAPNWWDKQTFVLDDSPLIHREILMWAHKDPCWYARTIIPQATYQLEPAFFDRLQSEPLGALIFNEDKIKRIALTPYPISKETIEYHWVTPHITPLGEYLWARQSLFTFCEEGFFCLIEIFLPALGRYQHD